MKRGVAKLITKIVLSTEKKVKMNDLTERGIVSSTV